MHKCFKYNYNTIQLKYVCVGNYHLFTTTEYEVNNMWNTF